MKAILLTGVFSLIAVISTWAVDPGQTAPDFSVTDLKGQSVRLTGLKGKVVVLEWVNYGCPFVHKHYASGNLPKLQKDYTGKGVVWITINSSAEGMQGYHPVPKMTEVAAQQGNAASHFVIDSDGKVGRAYGAKVTPHLFIIGSDGEIAYNGAIDSTPSTGVEDVATADPLFKNALDAVLSGQQVAKAKNKPYGCGVKYAK